jgi:hypothetical protein
MDSNRSTGDEPRRIEVDPDDVRVVVSQTYSYGAPPSTGGGSLPFLRRHRAKVAVAITVVEAVALGLSGIGFLRSLVVLLLAATLAIVLHLVAQRRAVPYTVRQLTWILAVSQILALLVPFLVIGGVIAIAIVLAFAILAGIVILIGDRR